jgi:hypothetical protein
MNPRLKLSIPLLLLLAAPLMAAQGYVYRDGDGGISVYKLRPDTQIRVGIDSPPSRSVTSTKCGLLVVTNTANYPTATIQVDRTVINPETLPTRLRPNCRQKNDGSHELDEPRTQHFRTEKGDIVIVNKTPDTRYEVTYPGQLRILTRNTNSCGFLRIRETQTVNFNQSILLPTRTGNSYAEFQISQLPTTQPLICHRGQLYYPQPWTNIFAMAIPGTEVAAALVEAVRAIPSAIASSGGSGGNPGGSGPSGGSGSGSTEGGDSSSPGDSGGSSGGSGGSGSSGSGDSGDGSGGGSSGGDAGSGDTGGSGNGGGSGSPNMYGFTLATYNPSIHDFNGDGLVDDATGNGIPDDRDGDGFPDGPWGPNDFANSAGPGFTIPKNASFCYGYNGNIVTSAGGFQRGRSYWLRAAGGNDPISDDNVKGVASYGATSGDPVVRFGGDWREPNFSHYFDDEDSGFTVASDEYMDNPLFSFYFKDGESCLVPPWMLKPPSWIVF